MFVSYRENRVVGPAFLTRSNICVQLIYTRTSALSVWVCVALQQLSWRWQHAWSAVILVIREPLAVRGQWDTNKLFSRACHGSTSKDACNGYDYFITVEWTDASSHWVRKDDHVNPLFCTNRCSDRQKVWSQLTLGTCHRSRVSNSDNYSIFTAPKLRSSSSNGTWHVRASKCC